MIFDRIFWFWFAVAGLFSIYLLLKSASLYVFAVPLLLVGIGIAKLSEESRKREKERINRKILDKIEKK